MWLRIVTLIRKEVLAVFRDPRNRAALILPPILQLFLFSFTGTLEVKHVKLGVWNEDYGQVANDVIQVVNQFVTEQQPMDNGASVQIVQRNWFNPNLDYIWFTLPSLAVMITLQICLNVTAMSVAREREMGTFDQLLVSPMQPLEIMAGKSIPALVLGLIEATVFIFRIPFHGSVPFLYLSLSVFITAMIGIGLSISSIAVTQQQALLGIMTILLPAVLLSGYAAPIENMPSWLQPITYANPLRYMMVVTKGVFLKDMPPLEILNNTWPMAIIAVFTLSFATWLFRRRLPFRRPPVRDPPLANPYPVRQRDLGS